MNEGATPAVVSAALCTVLNGLIATVSEYVGLYTKTK